jgi:putative redox protein
MDKVVIRQNQNFEFEIKAQQEGEEELREVAHIYELTPYTMMLASLGFCTGIVVHTYAHHHDVDLTWVELAVTYHREEHEDRAGYDEWIVEEMKFEGDLEDKLRERLRQVGHACSIRKMLEDGIEVRSRLAGGS